MKVEVEHRIRLLAVASGHRSLSELARSAGVDRHTVVDAVRGRRRVTRRTIQRLALGLGVEPAELASILLEARES